MFAFIGIWDKIHDVGAKCVIQARKELNNIFRHWKNNTGFRGKVQKPLEEIGVDLIFTHPS